MIVKVLIFVLVAYALYRLFMNDRKKKEDDSSREKEHLVATGEMVKDPVCGGRGRHHRAQRRKGYPFLQL